MLGWSFCPPFCIPALTGVPSHARGSRKVSLLSSHISVLHQVRCRALSAGDTRVSHKLLLLENSNKCVSIGLAEPALTVTAQTYPAATAAARTFSCQVSFPKSILWAKGKGCVAMDSSTKLGWMATCLTFPLLLVKAHLITWCLLQSVLTMG